MTPAQIPGERDKIPAAIIDDLIARLRREKRTAGEFLRAALKDVRNVGAVEEEKARGKPA